MERQNDQIQYKREMRIPVDIPVRISSVLVTSDAVLRNLTEHGALIDGISLAPGAHFQIEYEGQILFGIVAWAEDDRIGARFPFALEDGPLYTRLQQAVLDHEVRQKSGAANNLIAPMPTAHLPARTPLNPMRRPVAGFGRRGL
ncbi:hypothetical protein OOT33_00440 [Sphingobium sp. DEHP117]|uniref:hypothetical protein n=1 Tax=Sphingobium sp. DEHP117 TaxID=2993436 RepID=UPI0027D57CE6|nr:hypothetical protein [Sphingobium sp. DEHP117]MDQ4418915.1 hypothetical protein [Sphingobium sp. DEHP117]